MGFTFGLGLLLLVVFVVVRGVVSKRATQSRVGVFVCFGPAFLVMLGISMVPNRLTRIDQARGALVVSHMVPVPPWTMSTEDLRFEEVRALGVRFGVRGTKSKERVVRLFALPVAGELELGEAECPGSNDDCLEWADPAAAQLAKALGWKGKLRQSMTDSGKLRQYEPSARRESPAELRAARAPPHRSHPARPSRWSGTAASGRQNCSETPTTH